MGQTRKRPASVGAQVTVTLAATPEQLWPYVADTDRMDRSVGLPVVHFRQTVRSDGGEVVTGEYRVFGKPLARWTEHPFEWIYPRRFSVRRDYTLGPLCSFLGGTELTPVPSGTQVRSFVEIVLRSGLLSPLLRFGVLPIGLRRAARQHRAMAAYLAGQGDTPFPVLPTLRSQADSRRISAEVALLQAKGAPLEPLSRLAQLLTEGADEDVAGMRPLELAKRWGYAGRATLETFVRAAVEGLLELRWELLCPRCRGVKASAVHLRDLAQGGFCPTCNMHFLASVDEAIEARFYPNPGVRKVELGTYCVGSPTKTAHRLAQTELAADSSQEWMLDLAEGAYELNSPQSRGTLRLQVAAEAPFQANPVDVCLEASGPRPDQAAVRSGRVALRLTNATRAPITVALDSARFADTGATPGRLMTLPAFRTLLSSEALSPGYELAIGRVGLLFTDLAGSTALYERIGDARAFKLVGEHFELLGPAIEASGGAVVKTIGDAVMASFPDGLSAVTAAVELQRAMRRLEVAGDADPLRLLKVGVHAGACYAVTLNERLDYFGTAVNLAARAQNEAHGGEIVLTAAALDEGRPVLDRAQLHAAPFDVALKGFADPIRLYRIDPGVAL